MTDTQNLIDAPIGTRDSDTFYSATYEFVRMLGHDLMANTLDLPSFPDVLPRLREVLGDERTTAAQIERVIAADPALVARLMRIANSAALNPGGKPVTHLRGAVARMGHAMVRLAALSFAMAQLRQVSALRSFRARLETLWRHALTVAALAHVLTRRCRNVHPDEALLAGLLHVVGEFYIYAHAHRAPATLQEEDVLRSAVREWHAGTAKAILDAWGIAEHITRAIEEHEVLAREHPGSADLTDVLTAATARCINC